MVRGRCVLLFFVEGHLSNYKVTLFAKFDNFHPNYLLSDCNSGLNPQNVAKTEVAWVKCFSFLQGQTGM